MVTAAMGGANSGNGIINCEAMWAIKSELVLWLPFVGSY
jgi:hypothetical protein